MGLEKANALLTAISKAQSRFMRDAGAVQLFDELLADFLALSESEYGFIGEVLKDADGQPFFKAHAHTDVCWDEQTKHLYEQGLTDGMCFGKLHALYGAVLSTGEAVISNKPAEDPRSTGLPKGHPPLHAFLLVPVMSGDEMIGMIGVANRQSGYDQQLLDYLKPLIETYGRIIELRRANNERAEFHAQIEAVVDTAVDAIVVINARGVICSCNPAVESMFGYSCEALSGRNIGMLMPESHTLQHDAYMDRYSEGGKPKVVGRGTEVEGQRLDGSRFPIHISVSEFSVAGDRFFSGVIRDISELKHVENDLMLAKEEAERANQAKTEFLSSMSHELRTPLNAIMGFAQLFSYDLSANSEQKETADEIYKAGRHLRTLIDDILELGKIESGGVDVSLEPVDVFAALEECRSLVMPMLEKHGISLTVETGSYAGICVLADRTRLKQVFLNLLSNAVKYNREHGSVTVVCEKRDDGLLRIKFIDTGIGILGKDLDYLFKPFTRLVNEQSEIEGSGIGLSISKQFVELMQGEIGVDSQPGKGSCFWLELKIAEVAPRVVDEMLDSIVQPRGAASVRSGNTTILIVEDNPTNRIVFKHQFKALGLTPEIVSGPEEILSQLEEGPYDLILTDIHMPGMGGYDLVRHIRAQEKGTDRHVPVVAVTANVLAGERERCLEAGMDDYISKPVDIKALKKVVQYWLEYSGRSVELGYEVTTPVVVSSDELNLDRLSALVGGNVEQQRQIVNNFFETLPGTLTEIHAAWDAHDADKLTFWTHRFKSSAAAVGADALAKMCQVIEDFSRENEWEMLASFLGELESQVQRAVIGLRQALKQLERRKSGLNRRPAVHAIGRVLVVDDDPVILHALTASLGGLGVEHVFSADSGNEALTILDSNVEEMDMVFCDLNMPVMDGVEFLRHLVARDYQGAVVLLSGEDSRILNSARNLANAHSFHFVAAMGKPLIQVQLAALLEKVVNKKDVVAKPPSNEFSLRELRQAIEYDEFVVYYQPKIDTFNKCLVGVEALVRWQHPGKGFVMPDQFIPMAEENGLIDVLTDLVFEKAFAQLKQWRQQGLDFKMSINIAAGTIGRRLNFPEQVMAHLEDYGLSPDDVILEITESGVIDDLATTLDTLVRLRLKGVTLSIDDFGTGYSTFKQLQGIPFTELKIDKEFVMNGVSDPSSRAIVESSILLGKKLGMTLVAEGVESKEDWELLKKLGCHMLQGFFISKPAPAEQLEEWLEQWQASEF